MNNIKKYRAKASLTQAMLAESLCVSQGAITHYETGRRVPDLCLSRRIVAAFNSHGVVCSIDDVFPVADKTAAA